MPLPEKFYDVHGKERTLDGLCIADPAWAASRIRALTQEVDALTAAHSEPEDDCLDCIKDGECCLDCVLEGPEDKGRDDWISVDGRLPDFGDKCLVIWRGVLQYRIFFYSDGFEWQDERDEVDHGPFPGKEVTHWIPLPSPPEAQSTKDKKDGEA